jgi:hypothetical protein
MQDEPMNANDSLKVRVARRGDKFIWELYRDGMTQPVKFSAPLFSSEDTAEASGAEARTTHLARLAKRYPESKRYPALHPKRQVSAKDSASS